MSKKDNVKEPNEVVDQATSKEAQAEETTKKEETSLTVEEQLREDLAKEKDKFLRLFAEFEKL